MSKEFSKNYRREPKTFGGQKFVTRLVSVPEVVWVENFLKLFQIFGLPAPRREFSVYDHIDCAPFIRDATNAFRTALIGHALTFVGIKITFEKTTENGEPIPNDQLVPKISINKDREVYAIETIKALTRNYQSKDKYASIVNFKSQEDQEYLQKLRMLDPSLKVNTIVDVNERNDIK